MSSSLHSTIIPSDSNINDAIPPPQVIIALPAIVPLLMFNTRDFFPPEEISSPKDIKTHVESPIPISLSSSVGSSSPVRSTTPPPNYPLISYLSMKPLGSEPVLEESNMPPKRTSTSAAPAMIQDAIRQLVADSVAAALKAQAFVDRRNTTSKNDNNYSNNRSNNNYRDNHNNHNRNNDYHQQQNRRQDKKYHGNLPLCTRFTLHHIGVCTVKCQTCNKVGHQTRNCRSKGPATGSNLLSVSVTCHACGEKGHYKSQCSKIDNNTFHISKKSLCDKSLVIPMKEIWLDDKLNFVEESMEIMDREVKQLRQRHIPIVKVGWNSKITWEREDL
ncbi:putative reverse transcriptase domain-containing protein [Tanacetum coccineum]|uniref:Reverse transcriptase domain-containing protein n=1 Tax=Tanacetum coccineum TaxID=301880 RepID=A0ABQ4Y7B6_9ASTR